MNLYSARNLRAALALIFGAGLSYLAVAQTAPAPSAAASGESQEVVKLEKIEVTGSRLAPPDFQGALPVVTFDELEISKNTVETLNNFMRINPTTFGSGNIDEGTVNGGNGAAYIGLRGLPTLFLINGRRNTSQDLNTVPLAAIERVEVLKDGNGTVYGADAVGGVVNVITKHRFVGAEIDASYQNTWKNDISRRRFEVVFGDVFARGSITMGISLFKQNDLFSKDRDELTNTTDRSFGATSATPNPGKFNLTPAQALAMFGAVNAGTVSYRVNSGVPAAASPSDFRVGQYGNVPVDQSDRFPYSLYTPTVRPADRYNYWGSAEFELLKNNPKLATLYSDVFYMRNVSHAGLAPSPASFRNNSSDGNFTIPASYYWNQRVFGARAVDITSWDYRFLDLGPRDDKTTFTDFNFLAGVKGDITDRLSYDVNYSWNRNEQWDEELAGVNRVNLLKMLNGTSGLADADLFNPFTNPFDSGTVTNTALGLRYIDFTPRTLRTSTTRIGEFVLKGRPFDLPAGQVEVLAGYSKRWENYLREPDLAKQNATGSGWNGTDFFESQWVAESLFGEAVFPLLADMPFAKKLQLGTAVRRESYSHFRSKPTVYRAYLREQVNKDLTLRLSYSEGFTIPTPIQLDPTVIQNFLSVYMPWLGVGDQPNLGDLESGNPNLKPTTSKSYNLGVIWTPKQVKGLDLGIDLYKIKRDKIIIQDAQYYVDAFAAGGGMTRNPNGTFTKNNSAPFASQINVDTDGSQTGIPGYLIQVTDVKTENLGVLNATALDFDIGYTFDTDNLGRFIWRAQVTRMFKYEIQKAPNAPATDYLGLFTPNDTVGPQTVMKWKGNTSWEWDYKNFITYLRLNYNGAFKEDPDGGSNYTATVAAWPTWDLTVTYNLAKTGTSVTLGVENFFNKLPPMALSSFADKYDRSSHNILRRLVSVTVKQRF